MKKLGRIRPNYVEKLPKRNQKSKLLRNLILKKLLKF